MVAKIKAIQHINRAIYYNEHKVSEGVAECLYAGNFLKDAAQLSLLEKKQWFHQIMVLDQRIGKPVLHVPISFAPGENIAREKLVEIAREYMERIGFGQQPYLVYYHTDTVVPHLHIVTTTIRWEGRPIDIDFIGRDKSEPARKAIEEKYELVPAQKQRKAQSFDLRPLPVEKLQYGKRPTKQAITNALAYILETYKYRSISELNAILRLYNLKADPGKPGSRIYQHGGLLYQMLNEKGQPVGIPIKASSIYFKPGLQWLQKRFQSCPPLDPAVLQEIRRAVDYLVAQRPLAWKPFVNTLSARQIAAVPYINSLGILYGLSFVDLNAKVVLKASELGKGYSSQAILKRLGLDPSFQPLPQQALLFPNQVPGETMQHGQSREQDQSEVLDILFRSEGQQQGMPYELSQKANKKRKDQSKKL
ncbi:MAG TPA: relaxase/mobilization nuclease domain-containing protein [Puia sp.]|jgi:hypothetical protein|nr:relaxase/mobilization nuclease domain-containing protein [Puia sp.]